MIEISNNIYQIYKNILIYLSSSNNKIKLKKLIILKKYQQIIQNHYPSLALIKLIKIKYKENKKINLLIKINLDNMLINIGKKKKIKLNNYDPHPYPHPYPHL